MNEQVYEPTAADRKHCKKCRHHSLLSGNVVCCLYILDTHEPRGCKFGIGCDKYVKGKVMQRSFIYSVTDPEVRITRDKEYKSRNEMIAYKGEAIKRMRIKNGN